MNNQTSSLESVPGQAATEAVDKSCRWAEIGVSEARRMARETGNDSWELLAQQLEKSRADMETAMAAMTSTPNTPPAEPEEYLVRRGDQLIKVNRKTRRPIRVRRHWLTGAPLE